MCLFAECVYGWNLLSCKILRVRFAFLSLLFRFQVRSPSINSLHAGNLLVARRRFTGCFLTGVAQAAAASQVQTIERNAEKMNLFLARNDFHSWLKIGQLVTLRCRPPSACAVLLLSTPPIRSAVIHISVSRLHMRFLSFQVSVAHAVTQCSSRTAGAMYVQLCLFSLIADWRAESPVERHSILVYLYEKMVVVCAWIHCLFFFFLALLSRGTEGSAALIISHWLCDGVFELHPGSCRSLLCSAAHLWQGNVCMCVKCVSTFQVEFTASK